MSFWESGGAKQVAAGVLHQSRDRKRPKLLVHTSTSPHAAASGPPANAGAVVVSTTSCHGPTTAPTTAQQQHVFTPPELLLITQPGTVPPSGPSGASCSSHTLLLLSPADSPTLAAAHANGQDAAFGGHHRQARQHARSRSFTGAGAWLGEARGGERAGESALAGSVCAMEDDDVEQQQQQQHQPHHWRHASCGAGIATVSAFSTGDAVGAGGDAGCSVVLFAPPAAGGDDKENRCRGQVQQGESGGVHHQRQHHQPPGARANPSCLPPLPPPHAQPVPARGQLRQQQPSAAAAQDDTHQLYSLLMQSHHTSVPLRLCTSTQLCLLAQQRQAGSCCGTSNSSPAEHGSVGSCAWDASSQASGLSSYASLESHLAAADLVPPCPQPGQALAPSQACKLASRRSFALAGLSVDTTNPLLAAPAPAALQQPQPLEQHVPGGHAGAGGSGSAAPERAAEAQAAAPGAGGSQHLAASGADAAAAAALSSKAQHGWFSRCRGCAQLTGHEYLPGDSSTSAVVGGPSAPSVPLCAMCSRQLMQLDGDVRLEQEAQLLYIHGSWLQHGL